MSLPTTLRDLLEKESAETVAERVLREVEARRKANEARKAEEARRKAASETPAPVAPKPAPAGMRLHYKFPLLLAAVKAGVDGIALVGPAGTGKTTAARQAAKLTERHFEAVSFGPTTSKADLFGFIDAGGTYRETGLVRAAKAGGLFLGDEFDAGHPGVSVGLNMVLANPCFSTPVGMLDKHERFVGVVGMNTYGSGANRQYVGRNQLDAATLDRFAFIEWDLDVGLEAAMVGINGVPSPAFELGAGGLMSPKDWLARIWKVRAAVEALGVRHIVSPRATQNGVRLFGAGVGRAHVEAMVLWKGMDADTRSKVEARAA
jgi:hypothetical protein